MKKSAIITFDYEVFLGRQTGTIEKSVLRPTISILKILKEYNAKAIFFVDVTWLLFLKENFYDDFNRITSQLKEIITAGSSVELHLHPQWINAYKSGNQIAFKTTYNYKINSLTHKEILDLFMKSIDLLQNITDQKVKCFRAGGWCIDPFIKIRPAFEAHGIKYDFSVVPGVYLLEDKPFDFDFSNAPRLPYYKFDLDVQKPDIKGRFTELPVSTYLNNPVYRLTNFILLKIKEDRIFGDGKGIKEKSGFNLQTLLRRMLFSYSIMTLDKSNNLVFKYLIKTHFKNNNLLVIVSHPKTTSNGALNNLAYICKNFNTLNSTDLDAFLF